MSRRSTGYPAADIDFVRVIPLHGKCLKKADKGCIMKTGITLV